MSDRIASIHGVALRPGVSKNNRRYTPQAVQRAHDRLKARLADPAGRPVVMRSYHPPQNGSEVSVTNIAGQLTGVAMQENGDLHFDADIANTQAGRDVAALVTPARPYLANVSIHGLLVGESTTDRDGIEVIDDLEIDGLDFVTSPGVEAARILSAVVAESHGRHVITESAEGVRVTQKPVLTEADHAAIAAKILEGMKPAPIPLHEMSDMERTAYANEVWARAGIFGGRPG